MHSLPSGTSKIVTLAGTPSSGSRVCTSSTVTYNVEKNDTTDPTTRQEHAGCPTLLVHSASKSDLRSGSIVAMVALASRCELLGKATLTMSAPTSTPLRTARVKYALSRSTLKSRGEAMNTTFVVTVAAEASRTAPPIALDVASAEAGRTALPLTGCGFDMLEAKWL